MLCTPLKVAQYGAEQPSEAGERRIGVLYLDSREKGYLQAAGVLHALAAEAAVVIENARLYQEAVQAERAAQELRIASEIQRALLPPDHYSSTQVELVASTTPCRSVGGDLFDYVSRDEGSLSFTVADVAGKGTSAALLTAVVQGLLAWRVERGRLTRTGVRSTEPLALPSGRGVEIRHGLLRSARSQDGTLRYCNAGHNAPFLVTRTELVGSRPVERSSGCSTSASTKPARRRSSPGDLLVVFSDGVTEAVNSEGDEFEDERLGRVPRDSARQIRRRGTRRP